MQLDTFCADLMSPHSDNDDSTPYLIRLETKIDKMVEALNTLVIVEERQSNQKTMIDELRVAIKTLETKAEELDRKVDRWANRGIGVWSIVTTLWVIFGFAISHNFIRVGN